MAHQWHLPAVPVKMQIRCRYSDPCLSFVKQITEEMHIKPIAEQDSELLAQELTQRCIKVIRDRKEILPHKMGKKKILVLDFSVVYTGETAAKDLYKDLLKEGFDADFLYDPGEAYLDDIIETGAYELIICTIANQFAFGTYVVRVHGPQARNFMGGWPSWVCLACLSVSTILISILTLWRRRIL